MTVVDTPPDVDLLDPTFHVADPHPASHWMRAHEPVLRDRNGLVCVTRWADVRAVERRADVFVSDRGYRSLWTPDEVSMISKNDPEHMEEHAPRCRVHWSCSPSVPTCGRGWWTTPPRSPARVEELLRWVTPLNNMFRTAVADTAIAGAPVRDGDRIVLVYPSANRDESASTAPTRSCSTATRTRTWRSAGAPTSASAPTWPAPCCRSPSRSSPADFPA